MLWAELRALFRRTRVRVLLAAMAGVPVLLAVIVATAGGPRAGNGPPFLDAVSTNGVYVAPAALVVTVPFLLPLTVAVVAGDAIAGEASLGTLRYLLTRPAGRVRLLLMKGATVVVFCVAAALAVVIGGLIVGAVLFPVGPVLTLSGTTLTLGAAVLRALLAALVVAGSMLGVAAIGVFASTVTDAPVGAIAVTVGLIVVSAALQNVPEVAPVHPWLFSIHWQAFADLLRSPVRWHDMGRDLLLQAAYVAVFGSAAWARFTTRDILA
ncbi:MAG: ABC transporter permease [Acidimicrobiales bacterium]